MSTGITTPSPQGLEFIKRFQGLSLEKYRDAEGLWVIGYGHLIREGERFDGCLTHAQAEMLFREHVGGVVHCFTDDIGDFDPARRKNIPDRCHAAKQNYGDEQRAK